MYFVTQGENLYQYIIAVMMPLYMLTFMGMIQDVLKIWGIYMSYMLTK